MKIYKSKLNYIRRAKLQFKNKLLRKRFKKSKFKKDLEDNKNKKGYILAFRKIFVIKCKKTVSFYSKKEKI